MIYELGDIAAPEQLITAIVEEHALGASFGALSALGQQRVAAASTISAAFARWQALDQGVQVQGGQAARLG